jgi:RNA polymerase sigma-70 factor (ECF subfamily)
MAERDTALIGRMAGGDEKAFEELYTANARKVFAYLRSRNIDNETAADILQNTFVAAWRGAGRFQGGAKALTWLISIARHKLADEIRVRARARASPLDEASGSHDPIAEAGERLSVRQAVAALGEEQRELLHLVFVLGFNYAEAAQVLEVPEGTVKSRMFALKKLLAGRLATEVGV